MHTYIGSRYVPKFMGLYDATQAYEALSVVDNGMGTSYITKVPTPAGTPLTDTDYYAVYGASSGAIINLQNQIDDMNDGTVSGSLQEQINTNALGITALTNKIDTDIMIIGNSFVGMGCGDEVAACFAGSHLVHPYGGVGFVPYTGHTMAFEDELDYAINDTSIDKNLITDILFVSAMGDCRAYHAGSAAYQTSLIATFTSIMTKIAANYPNCKHVKVTLAESRLVPYFYNGDYADSNFNDLFDVHKIFKRLCPRYGLEYIGWSGFNNLFVSGMFEADNYHPSTSGAKAIGSWIKTAYFANADYETKEYNQLLPCTYSTGATLRVLGYYTPDECRVQLRNIANASTGISVNTVANGDIVDTLVTNSALPAPSISLDIISPLIDSLTYTQDDTLYYSFTKDTYGALKVISLRNPTASTISHNSLAAPNVSEVSFAL